MGKKKKARKTQQKPALPPHGLPIALAVKDARVNQVSWSPDGQWLATTGQDGFLRVWTGEQSAPVHSSPVQPHCLAFSPDSKSIAWAGAGGALQVTRIGSTERVTRLHGEIDPVAGIAWTADGTRIIGTVARQNGFRYANLDLDDLLNEPLLSLDDVNKQWDEVLHTNPGMMRYLPTRLGLKPESSSVKPELVEVNPRPLRDSLHMGNPSSRVSIMEFSDKVWVTPTFADRVGAIALWDLSTGAQRTVIKSIGRVKKISMSPNGKMLAVASSDRFVRVYDTENWVALQQFRSNSAVTSLGWSPDSVALAAGNSGAEIWVWNAINGSVIKRLEGHTSTVVGLAFAAGGNVLTSFSIDGSLILWNAKLWTLSRSLKLSSDALRPGGLAVHPREPLLASALGGQLTVWRLDPESIGPAKTTLHYASAKVVLVGDSAVGKTSLARAILNEPFTPAVPTTHGMQMWTFTPDKLGLHEQPIPGQKREIVVWDLGGQEWYQLVHQLFLPETTVVVLVVDPTRGQISIDKIREWDRRIASQCNQNVRKLLVGAKMDASDLPIDEQSIQTVQEELGYFDFIKTSARTGRGLADLKRSIWDAIDWEALGTISRPELFEEARLYLLKKRQQGAVVLEWADLARDLKWTIRHDTDSAATYNAVARSLARQGLIVDVTLGRGRRVLILQPEVVNTLAGSVVLAALEDPRESGAIEEQAIRDGRIRRMEVLIEPDGTRRRLAPRDERDVMEAVIQLLLQQGLAFRHAGLLCLPAMFRLSPEPVQEGVIETPVHYTFSGSIDTIYSQLVVLFSYSERYIRVGLWENKVLFEHRDTGVRCGLALTKHPGGHARIDAFFPKGTSEDARMVFTKYVEEHLIQQGLNVVAGFSLKCSACDYSFDDAIVQDTLRDGQQYIFCPRGHSTDIQEALRGQREQTEEQVVRTGQLHSEIESALTLAATSPKQDVLLVFLEEDRTRAAEVLMRLEQFGLSASALEWTTNQESVRNKVYEVVVRETSLQESGALAVFVGKAGWTPWQATGVSTPMSRFMRAGRSVVLVSESADAPQPFSEDVPVTLWRDALTMPPPGVLRLRGHVRLKRARTGQQVPIRILQLADLHIGTDTDPESLLHPLFQDLHDPEWLGIDHLDYIVMSGDISQHAAPEEYRTAVTFTRRLMEEFGVPASRLIVVPGNHDVDWETVVYESVSARKVNESTLAPGKFLKGSPFYHVRNDSRYPERFRNFSQHFVQPIFTRGRWADAGEQFEVLPCHSDGLVFVGLNSGWEIDEIFPDRASINQSSLSRALQQVGRINRDRGDRLLGLAVWHHPITGNDKIKDDAFLELMVREGIVVFLTGHVHDTREEMLRVHRPPALHAVGTGSFGAITADLPPTTPNLYTLLEVARDLTTIRVHTRAKPRAGGAWRPHPVYGQHNHPEAYYDIPLKR